MYAPDLFFAMLIIMVGRSDSRPFIRSSLGSPCAVAAKGKKLEV